MRRGSRPVAALRAAVATLVALALPGAATPAPAAAGAAAPGDRLVRLADALRERPLAIDGELAWFIDGADEARLERAVRRSRVAFHVAVLPLLEQDESGGDGDRVVVALHERLGRPGIYLVIDENGYFHARAYDVPREVRVWYGLEGPPVDSKPTAREVVDRMQRLIAQVAAAPPGRTHDDHPLSSELRPYGETSGGESATATAVRDFAIIGGMAGLVAGWVARRRARREAAPTASRRLRARRARGRRR